MGTILITGICGSLARLTARLLLDQGHAVVGVDYRAHVAGIDDRVVFYRANYNKTRIEDVFRRHTPTSVLHMGRVGNLKAELNKRYDLNVLGSAKIMDQCVRHGVRRLVVLSTFHIYGAHPHNHIPISEDEPLRATRTFPQIADAVQLDNQAVTWVYRHPELRTAVLRPCNIIGRDVGNGLSRYLRQPRLFYMMGFNPVWQFLHQNDLVRALVDVHASDAAGVFNVAGPSLPIVDALEVTGKPVWPMPSSLARLYLSAAGSFGPALPTYLLDFLKFPCVIAGDHMRETFGFEPRHTAVEALRETVGLQA